MLTSALSSSLGTLSVVSLSVHREKNTGLSFLPLKPFGGSGSVLKYIYVSETFSSKEVGH